MASTPKPWDIHLPSGTKPVMQSDLSSSVRRVLSDSGETRYSQTGGVRDTVTKMGTRGFQADPGIFMGRDAGTYKFGIGDPNGAQMYFDGTSLVSSNLTLTANKTAGRSLLGDWGVAISASDGKVYPMRPDSITGTNTTFGTTVATATKNKARTKFFNLSSTVKAFVTASDGGTSYIARLAVTETDPTTATITSATVKASEICTDAVKLDSTKLFAVTESNAGSNELEGRIISGLDTTITVGTGTVLTAGNISSAIACDIYDATTVLVAYGPAAAPFKAQRIQNATWSGTTVTAGTETTLFTATNVSNVCAMRRFGTTATYLYVYADSTNIYARGFSFNGSSYTVGSEITIGATSVSTDTRVDLESIDSTHMLMAYNDGTNFKTRIITVSGVTATAGTATTLTGTPVATQTHICLAKFSASVFTASYQVSTNVTTTLLDIDTVAGTVTALGSSSTLSSSAAAGTSVAGRFNPKTLVIGYMSGAATFTMATLNCQTNYANFTGFSNAAVSANETASIEYAGIANLSGLTIGSTYYRDADENVTTTTNVSQGTTGFAVSTTELSIRP